MSKILFNIDDLALILVITACVLHVLVLRFQSHKFSSQIVLSLFLVSLAVENFDTLIYWSAPVKQELMGLGPHIFFIFKCALFLQPPLLYLYTKYVIFADFSMTRSHLVHFLPAVIYLCCVPFVYLSLGENLPKAILQYEVLFADPVFKTLMWASKLAFLFYGCAAVGLLSKHRENLEHIASSTEGVDASWLKLLVVGFLVLWLWGTCAQLLNQMGISALADFLGLTENYLRFLLINTLVFLSISRTSRVHQQRVPEEESTTGSQQTYTEEQIGRVKDAMQSRKAYLDPELSLEQLSAMTSIPQRLLSSIINRHFEKNFFEFVNYHRVEHAKVLLRDNKSNHSMLDVMAESGFNSKSAFNRFFKKFTEMTPTQYRNQPTS